MEIAVEGCDGAAEERALKTLRIRLHNKEVMTEQAALHGLSILKRCRRFDRLVEFGDLVDACGCDNPVLRKLYAQGLIELADYERAIEELEKTRTLINERLTRAADENSIEDAIRALRDRYELTEIDGLLGRAYKQRCFDHAMYGITEGRIKDAVMSLTYYGEAYHSAPVTNLWHGINYVALTRYAQRNLQLDPGPGMEIVAREIVRTLDYLETEAPLGVWELATRAEAYLALGDSGRARDGYAEALAAPGADSFMRGSARRQLEQIWELPQSHEILALFDEPRPPEASVPVSVPFDVHLQARFKDSKYNPVKDHPMAIERARGVVRLGVEIYVGDGTGFLIDGSTIHKKLDNLPLVLTCRHVCPNDDTARRMKFIFFGSGRFGGISTIEISQVLWASPVADLDAALLLINDVPRDVQPAPLSAVPVKQGDLAYVIGHPLGGAKFASLFENLVQEVANPRFYYLSAADPGSSGSPVFNGQWEVTGIHRAGPQAKQANEGTRLDRILAAMRAHPW